MPNDPASTLVRIHVKDRHGIEHHIEVPPDLGLNLMEVCVASALPIHTMCGGLGLCGGCHIYVVSNHQLFHRSAQEEETLDKLHYVAPGSRLACQMKVSDQMDGIHIELAPEH